MMVLIDGQVLGSGVPLLFVLVFLPTGLDFPFILLYNYFGVMGHSCAYEFCTILSLLIISVADGLRYSQCIITFALSLSKIFSIRSNAAKYCSFSECK